MPMRDSTYVDGVVEGVIRVVKNVPASNGDSSHKSSVPARVYNIGNNQRVLLLQLIRIMEEKIGKKALMNMLPMQAGDVPVTYADIE